MSNAEAWTLYTKNPLLKLLCHNHCFLDVHFSEIFLIEDNFPLPNVQKGYIKCFLAELGTTLAFEGVCIFEPLIS